MVLMKGWRYTAFISGIVGAICIALYPIIIDPYINPEKWQEVQKEGRRGVHREQMQPGGQIQDDHWLVCYYVAPNARGSMGFIPCLFGKGKMKLLYLMAVHGMKVWSDPFEKK